MLGQTRRKGPSWLLVVLEISAARIQGLRRDLAEQMMSQRIQSLTQQQEAQADDAMRSPSLACRTQGIQKCKAECLS